MLNDRIPAMAGVAQVFGGEGLKTPVHFLISDIDTDILFLNQARAGRARLRVSS